jgi:hypothetical protein
MDGTADQRNRRGKPWPNLQPTETRSARPRQAECEGKEALLLSRKIVTALYHNDDAALKRTMARTGIDEEQDLISRFIRGADNMSDKQLTEFIRLP